VCEKGEIVPKLQSRVRGGATRKMKQRVEVREIQGRVRGRGGMQQGIQRGRRRVIVERVPVVNLPGRKEPFCKQFYTEKGTKRRRICRKDDGQVGNIELDGLGENRSSKMDRDGLKEGFWWEVQPGLEGRKFPNAQMTEEQIRFVDKVWEE
jgi:hypothetical protein